MSTPSRGLLSAIPMSFLLILTGCPEPPDDDDAGDDDASSEITPTPGDDDDSSSSSPTPVSSPTPEEPTPTPSPVPSPTPEEPTPTPTPVPTPTPEEPTPTPSPTPEEPTPTPSPTPEEPTPTPSPTPEEPSPTPVDADGDGHSPLEADGDDCDDTRDDIYPGAPELEDGRDNDCDGLTDEGTSAYDDDGDGFTEQAGDCDDSDASVYLDALELPDGLDNDCDTEVDEGTENYDDDGDGFTELEGDCDDEDQTRHPEASEVCDEIDNNCDEVVDLDAIDLQTYFPDTDRDGYGDPANPVSACAQPDDAVSQAGDCDDTTDARSPGAIEVCDQIDNDCDEVIDEEVQLTFYRDADGDGYGDPASSTQACLAPEGYATSAGDCDDKAMGVSPSALELCDGIDNDCDDSIDEPDATDASTWYPDQDGDGYGDERFPTLACSVPDGYVGNADDCDDEAEAAHPDATEVCDGLDNNCDQVTDDVDFDEDGHIADACDGDDCDDENPALYGSCDELPPLDSLVGLWRFEDSGNVVEDSSAYGNDGKLYGAVATAAGKIGQGFKMKDGACVVIPDSSSLSMVGGKAITYMAWIYYTGPCNSDRGMILNKESTYEMGVYCGSGDYFQEAVQLSNGDWYWTGATPVKRNAWSHVAVVWNGSQVQQYMNGVAVGAPRNLSGQFADRTTGLGLGCRGVTVDASSVGGSYFNGVLDELAVYSRALSASEIAEYVAATR